MILYLKSSHFTQICLGAKLWVSIFFRGSYHSIFRFKFSLIYSLLFWHNFVKIYFLLFKRHQTPMVESLLCLWLVIFSQFLICIFLFFFFFLIPLFCVPYYFQQCFTVSKWVWFLWWFIFFFLRCARSLSSLSGILSVILSSYVFALRSCFIKVFNSYLRFLLCHTEFQSQFPFVLWLYLSGLSILFWFIYFI